MAGLANPKQRAPQHDMLEPTASVANDNKAARVQKPSAQHARSQSGAAARRVAVRLVTMLFSIALATGIAIGWLNRDESYLTPKEGVGYWFGVAGSLAMLLLLIYPLSKRKRSSSVVWRVALWFRVHIVLGLVGPTLIVLHSNFTFGALNSNVALIVMLIVVGSGFVGRFLLRKINHEIQSHTARIERILADARALMESLGDGVQLGDTIASELNRCTAHIVASPHGVLPSLWSLAVNRRRIGVLRKHLLIEVRRVVRAESNRFGWSRRERRRRSSNLALLVKQYAVAARKVTVLTFYDRLFALWHALHLPLFILLVMAACIHIIAVHHY